MCRPTLSGLARRLSSYRDLDLAETGTRELSGEWVVGTEVWKRLKAERRARQESQRRRRRGLPTPENPVSDRRSNSVGHGRDSSDVEVNSEMDGLARKSGARGEKVIYYIHGGAYYVGNAATHRLVTIGISKACNARVFGQLFVTPGQI